MINKSIINAPTGSRLTQVINNFSSGIDCLNSENALSSGKAIETYNFDFKTGALKNGIGLSSDVLSSVCAGYSQTLQTAFEQFTNILKVWLFSKVDDEGVETNFLILLTSTYDIYSLNLTSQNTEFQQWDFSFTSIPEASTFNLNGEDVIIFSSKTDSMQVWDGETTPTVVADAPRFVSMCIHGERMFALTEDTKTLWFSDDLDPTSWNVSLEDAGFIQMMDNRGALRKVVSWNGYVYIFRDYGISRLTATGSQETFALTHLFTGSGKIFSNSVCVCGDRVLFLSEDGLYSFDGASTTQILTKLSPKITAKHNENCTCGFFNGKYYLACNMDFDASRFSSLTYMQEVQGTSNNALVVIDAQDLSYDIVRGIDTKFVCPFSSGEINTLFVVAKNSCVSQNHLIYKVVATGNIDSTALPKLWTTNYSSLSRPHKRKCLKSVFVGTNADLTFVAKSDEGEKAISVFASSSPQEYTIMLSGKKFCFAIYSTASSVFVVDEVMLNYATN